MDIYKIKIYDKELGIKSRTIYYFSKDEFEKGFNSFVSTNCCKKYSNNNQLGIARIQFNSQLNVL